MDDQGTSTRDGRRYATNGQDQRDKQNRSITGWVKPGTTFRFTIDVRDLDDIELGALAWLLTLPDGHFHRLGLGRPLGFGSVRLAIDPSRTTLHSAADYVAYYRTLSGTLPETDGHKVLQSAGDMFDQIVENSPSLGAIRDAFQVVTSGDPNIPVHYPRVLGNKLSPNAPAPPDPRGRNFEWFTQNERTGQDAPKGTRRSLPAATDRSHPLVVFPEPPPEKSKGPKSGGKNGNNRRKG
ncbi:hypothetical protein [Thermocatellispora tengchongensis]|uniref:hypothetical protein n=1 Tax=Thermocatellispora tengchongensis TaxID=1073253 RepID=UPI00363ED0F9